MKSRRVMARMICLHIHPALLLSSSDQGMLHDIRLARERQSPIVGPDGILHGVSTQQWQQRFVEDSMGMVSRFAVLMAVTLLLGAATGQAARTLIVTVPDRSMAVPVEMPARGRMFRLTLSSAPLPGPGGRRSSCRTVHHCSSPQRQRDHQDVLFRPGGEGPFGPIHSPG